MYTEVVELSQHGLTLVVFAKVILRNQFTVLAEANEQKLTA
jgi:hypothetical protein